jgi:predicted transcriptional regulator of viral defense system
MGGNHEYVTDGNLPEAVRGVGVRTMAEWLGIGLSRRTFQRLVAAGSLVRLRRGVYATKAADELAKCDPTFRYVVQVAAARAATGRDSVASHESAALMHGIALLRKPRAGRIVLSRPLGAWKERTRTTGIVLRVADLPDAEVTTHQGVRVTTVARTIADLARTRPFMGAVVSADNALHQQKTTKAEISQVLAAYPRWPGAAKARRAIEFADGRAESVLESCARVVFAEEGLPAPDLQVHVGGLRYVGRVDFFWPEFGTIAEADGALKYRKGDEAAQQLERDQLLRCARFRVVHFGWQHVFYERQELVSRIWQTLRGEIG